MGGGDHEDDCIEGEKKVNDLRSDIAVLLKKQKKTLNVLVVGTPGVGKSSFLNSVAAALSGYWHEHAYSGKYGGEGRPMSFFVQRFPDCCLSDEGYRKQYMGGRLPTLIDLAGLPDEKNDVYEEILRMLMYGRLPEQSSVALAEEIGRKRGVEGLRKEYPTEDRKLKVDRVLFLASANEKIPEKLINCVVRAARPPGSSEDMRTRNIPLYGVMTKLDTVEQSTFEQFQIKATKFTGCLGLQGSEQRLVKCVNYCSASAPERTDKNYPEIDVPILKFLKLLVDPFIRVTSDQEVEDYSYLSPPKPKPPTPDGFQRVLQVCRDSSSYVNANTAALALAGIGLLVLFLSYAFRSPQIDERSLQSTCTRVRHGTSLSDFPELERVCQSLDTVQHCMLGYFLGLLFLIAAGLVLFVERGKPHTPIEKKED